MDWSNPGSSDFHIYKDGFHDRLSKYWPEPREQLHAGGWARTREMVADIKRLTAGVPEGVTRVLDLCCGEGATATHVAATEGWEVTGVELVESAVMVARARAEQYGTFVRVKLEMAGPPAAAAPDVRVRLSYHSVPDLVRIAHASIHYMPLPSNSYDVVYGQDPDGLANENRICAFKEVLRVLRPGGLFYFWHHWIPGPAWPRELLEEYWADPLTGSPRLSHECYLEDIRASGLHLVSASETTALAASHMGGMAARMRREAPSSDGSLPDKWLERALQFADRGGSMGIQVVAFKPPAPAAV